MANAKFVNCLNIHDPSYKLPPEVINDLTHGNRSTLVTYIKSLKEVEADVKAKHDALKATYKREAVLATPAGQTVDRPIDADNELNQFRTTGFSNLIKNLVQRLGTIANVLKSQLLDQYDITEADQKVLADFSKANGFGQKFNQAFDKIFATTKDFHFRFKDPIQYIPIRDPQDNSKTLPLANAIKEAMAATAYEWVNTDGIMATGQTRDSLKRMFNIPKDKEPSESFYTHLLNIGISRDQLADQLGRTILERINIKPTENADAGAERRMIRSLGFMAIATMENMTFSDGKSMLRRHELYNGSIEAEFGIEALREGIPVEDADDVFYDPSPEQRALDNDPTKPEYTGKKGRPTKAYIRLNTDRRDTHELHTDFAESHDLLIHARDAFDKVFGTTTVVPPVFWKRIKLKPRAKVGRLGDASESQTRNLQKNVDIRYTKSVHIMDTFLAITGEFRDMMLGVEGMGNHLFIREKSVEGTNRGIARDLRMLEEHLALESEYGSEFYVNARFQSQHRMLQTGMNPQNSKIIRNLFSPEAWMVSFDPKTDKALNDAFIQAVALAFDIETLKVGGKTKQLKKFQAKLEEPIIKDAITILRKFHHKSNTNKTLTADEQKTIATAVDKLGTKLHGLKGLVEYARYLNHKSSTSKTKGNFTTDIYNEMDGVSNGPIIGMLMLIPDNADKQALLASLAMGGISVDNSNNTPNLDKLMGQHNLNDAYQRMGQEWALIEARMKEQFDIDSKNNKLKKDEQLKAKAMYAQMLALETLLGRFTENKNEEGEIVNDGIINKIIRNLSKPRTMQTMYGAMITTQNAILAEENVISEGIYDAIEKIIKSYHEGTPATVLKQDLIRILNATKALTSDHSNLNINDYFTNGKLDIEVLQGSKDSDGKIVNEGFKLNRKQIQEITWATRNTYGEAMKQAIEKVYAPVISARKPFKTLNQRAATVYNLVLRAKWKAAIEAKNRLLDAEYQTKLEEFEQHKRQVVDAAKKLWMPIARQNPNYKSTPEYKAIIDQQTKDIGSPPHKLELQQEYGRLTVKEAKEVTDSIAYLIPKIETPRHTDTDNSYLYLAKPGSARDTASIDEGQKYSEATTVEQSYANDTPLARGYVDNISYLANLSVSGGMVGAIQMIDGMVANHMMGIEGVDLLNVHDATVHSIKDIGKINYEANNIFKEIMFGSDTKPAYSIGQAIWNMHKEMVGLQEDGKATRSLASVLAENNVSLKDQIQLFWDDNVINPDTYGISEDALNMEIDALRKDNELSYNKAKDIAFKEMIGLKDNMTIEEQQEFLDKLHGLIDEQAELMAEQVTRNKEEIGKYVTHVAQFPNNGTGNSYTSESQESTINGVNRNTILSVAASQADATIQEMNTLYEKGYSGSSATDVSIDPVDYITQNPDTRHVNAMNVSEVFDSIVNMDEQAADASVPISEPHKNDLKRILHDIVSMVMKPVEFYMASHQPQNDQTAGAYTPHNTSIWIQRQQVGQPASGMLGQGIRMSAAEVYAHELIHHITFFGLRNNAELMRQAYDLYEFARESFMNQYGNDAFKVFMNDPNDMSNPYEVQAAKERWNYLFNPKQNTDKTHSGVDEFLAFGMTNENFKRELANLAISQQLLNKRKTLFTIFEKNIQTTIVNLYRLILDFIQNLFHQQQHSNIVSQEVENLVTALAKVDSKNKNVIFSAAVDAEAKATEFGLAMDKRVQNVANSVMNKFQLGRAITKLRQLSEAQNMIGHQLRVALLWYKDQQQGFIPALFNEMKGADTDNLKKLYSLQAKNNLLIDIAKQEAAKIMSAVNRDWFDRKLSTHEKTAITKVLLRGDISFLEGISSFAAIKGFVESPTQRKARLDALQVELQALVNTTIKNPTHRQQIMNSLLGGVQDLAYGMATGERFLEGINYLNAHNLALLDNNKYAGRLATSPVFNDIVNRLDQMASISSLNYMSARDKHAVAALMNSHPEAINNVLINHKLLQQQAKTDLFNGNPALMEKGYVKTLLNPRIQFEQGTLADEQAFADRGFTRVQVPFKRDGQVDPVKDDIYMYISHNGSINDFLSGVFSTTRNKQKGANAFDIQLQLGNQVNPALVANNNNAAALKAIRDKADAMLHSTTRTKAPIGHNAMTPMFNTEGKMIKLRYIMSEHMKDTVLQQFSEFDTVLGSMASQIVDKLNTPIINAEAVAALRDMWEDEKDKYPEAYVKIGPTSPIQRYREIYDNLPHATKQHILSEWGENSMMVSQEVIDLVFGQRKYSITEMFEKNDLERNMFERLAIEAMTFVLGFSNPLAKKELESVKGRAVTRAKTIEDFLVQLTKLAKGNIIVRNIRVTWGNHVSNVMYLKSKGVPLKSIIQWQREAFTSALQYQADNDKLQALIVKRDVITADTNINQITKAQRLDPINRQILRLQHILANNPSTKMIEAGLLPSIVDDVNTEIEQSPYKFGLEKGIDTVLGKLPEKVERAGRVLFMTEDTEGFKTLNNMVKMTDYVGRYVLYKHYTSKGMLHKEAVERVTDEFINFAPPTHRLLEYANNIGLVWFSKYQLRVLKHIKNIVRDHPFSALATWIIGSTVHHNNILNTIPFITKDAGRIIGDPLSAAFSSAGNIFTLDALDTITPNFK